MAMVGKALLWIVAAIQTYAFVLEMFLWSSRGPTSFSFLDPLLFSDSRLAEGVAIMAHNQGLYNVFLAIGLLWAIFESDARHARRLAICFLSFVLAAGLYGTLGTIGGDIFWTPLFAQAIPAGLALIVIMMDRSKAA